MEVPETKQIEPLSQPWRVTALLLNVAAAWGLYWLVSGNLIPGGSGASVWLYAVIAYWLLSLVAAPFFLPPRDSLNTAIASMAMLAPINVATALTLMLPLQWLRGIFLAIGAAVALLAVVAIFYQNRRDLPISQISYRLSGAFGKGEILFTPAVIISAIGFYADPTWTLAILGYWVFVLGVHPIELLLRICIYLWKFGENTSALEVVGTILRVDDPDIVRVSLVADSAEWRSQRIHVASLPDGRTTYVVPLFSQTQNEMVIGTGLCCVGVDTSGLSLEVGQVHLAAVDGVTASGLIAKLSDDDAATSVVGIVHEGSDIATIRFQVVAGTTLEEGMVVFALIRGKKVYFQILDAKTEEESFHQNPYGSHIASAAQLGSYDSKEGFKKFPWLPRMNQPLFLASEEAPIAPALEANEFVIGDVPHTQFGVPVVLDDLVEYHTAVLGMTGTGKTELALELVRNGLNRDTKVFCVDFTGEYIKRLADHGPHSVGLTIEEGSRLEELLFAVETGEYGAKKEKAALQEFIDEIKPQVEAQVDAFLSGDEHRLAIFELSEITNTKATLRVTELYLSTIMSWARAHRRARRIMIVLEEAHTIVPEPYGSGFDSETQWVVSRIGQIALQGRKYGVGLLVISQRTALVSKTILSQCNTYFVHALVDKTSLDYLASVLSADFVAAIPNLRFLEFIAVGKAVKSERPLIANRSFDPDKAAASAALAHVAEEEAEGEA